MRFVVAANLLGLPAISVPVSLTNLFCLATVTWIYSVYDSSYTVKLSMPYEYKLKKSYHDVVKWKCGQD